MSQPPPSGLPQAIMRAHQLAYYVECDPILSDHEYDQFCASHGLQGGGGSDRAGDYTDADRAVLATLRVKLNAPKKVL